MNAVTYPASRTTPNLSLNTDVPRAGASPAAATRRLACFVRRRKDCAAVADAVDWLPRHREGM